MILLWLATSVICQQAPSPPEDIVYGGPRNSGILHYLSHRPESAAPEPYTVEPEKADPATDRPKVDIEQIVAFHERKSANNQLEYKKTNLYTAISESIAPQDSIDPLTKQLVRDYQLQKELLVLAEIEYAQAAEAAFAWMMQEA